MIDFYRNLFENSFDMIYIHDLEGKFIDANPAALRVLGYALSDIKSLTLDSLLEPVERNKADEMIAELKKFGAKTGPAEFIIKTINGACIHIETVINLLHHDGAPYAIQGVARDITERKRAEEMLHASEAKFRGMFETSSDFLFITSLDGAIIEANPAACKITGYSMRELKHMNMISLHQDPTMRDILVKKAMAQGYIEEIEIKGRKKDGTIIDVLVTAMVRKDHNGNVTGFQGSAKDITKRKRAEEALAESRDRLDKIINSIADPLFVKDRQHRWVLLNDAFCSFMGFRREELLGKSDYDFFPEHEADIFWQNDDLVFQTGRENVNVERFTDAHRNVHTIDTKKTLYRDEKGKECIVGIIRDITTRKQIEEVLRLSEEKFSTIFRLSPIVISITTLADGRYTEANDMWYKMLEFTPEEVIGHTATELGIWVNAEDRENLKRIIMDGGKIRDNEYLFRSKSGKIYTGLYTAEVIDIAGVHHLVSQVVDITERKRAEEAVRRSEAALRSIFENVPAGICLMRNGAYTIANRYFYDTFGYKEEDVIGRTTRATRMLYESDEEYHRVGKDLYADNHERGVTSAATRLRCSDGSYRNVIIVAVPIHKEDPASDVVVIIYDITERALAEAGLKKSLREKETLLRELYHRTRNNMSTIISMLNMQSHSFSEKMVVDAFTDAKNRIISMALVHEKLYEIDDLSSINLKDYIKNLTGHLMKSFGESTGRVSIEWDLEDVYVLIDTAVPCGLILNELLSNTFKYAFPEGTSGTIRTSLHRRDNGEIIIAYSDNGVGMPRGFDVRRDGHMGFKLVLMLAENQLKADITVEVEHGVTFTMRFTDDKYRKRI